MKKWLFISTISCIPFTLIAQKQFSVVISEFFPDPTPSIGMPAFEFIELHNASKDTIALKNWKISDGTTTATISAAVYLWPDSNVIICATTAFTSFKAIGTTIAVSNFPSLNNDQDQLILWAADGRVIHSIAYNLEWYKNALKAEGGWSIEMIDLQRPCGGIENYKASTDPSGGTPGRRNAVNASNPDLTKPFIERAYTLGTKEIKLLLHEPLDSASAIHPLHYWVEGVHPVSVQYSWPENQQVILSVSNPLQEGHLYPIVTESLRDCAGNPLDPIFPIFVSTTTPASPGDLVFSEILFNPPPNGYDYIEVFNQSGKTIDLSEINIAAIDATGKLGKPVALSLNHHVIFPSEYKVLAENTDWVSTKYKTVHFFNKIPITSMPSMPDDAGTVVLLDQQGNVLEKLSYQEQWHFPLLIDKEGVALERIYMNQPVSDPDNWMSAAAAVGYGTPGGKNSQQGSGSTPTSTAPTPSVFSPDQDGRDDFVTIDLHTNQPGMIGHIFIYDKGGRPVRTLQLQKLLALGNNTFQWNGLDGANKKLPVGIYIIQTQIISASGKIKTNQYAVALVSRE